MLSKAALKYIQSLQQKKYRARYGTFLVEGAKSVGELLASDFAIEKLYLTAEFLDKNTQINRKNIPYELIGEKDLAQAGTFATNNAVLAVARMKLPQTFQLPVATLTLALDEVRDPGNLGTIIRLADWYGLTSLLCSDTCADFYNPKVIAATMGSFTRVTPHYLDLPAFLQNVPPAVPVYGAALHGQNVHRLRLQPAGILVLGNEAHGIRPEVAAQVRTLLHIPRFGRAESLNVANAAGILLDNFFRHA